MEIHNHQYFISNSILNFVFSPLRPFAFENMKILMINDSLILGGRERRITEVVKGLAQNNITVELILLRDVIDYPDIHKYASKVHVLSRRIKKDPAIFLKIRRIQKAFNPDIIHSWGSMSSIYALPSVIFSRAKFLNAMIADASCKRFSKFWLRSKLTFPFSDSILSNSMAGLKAYGIAEKSKAHVIHNGYDFNRSHVYEANQIKQQYDIRTKHVVAMVAAFHNRRDYITYLNAAVNLCRRYPDVTFLCVGDGPTEEASKKLVPEDLLHSRVKFLGFQKNVEAIVGIIDIGVLLVNANIIQEGLSNAIVEYMAHSKPVIATDSGGSHEIVIEGQTGYFVRPYSVPDLEEKISILLDDEPLRIKMGKQGYENVKANFSYDAMIGSTIKLYKQLLGHK